MRAVICWTTCAQWAKPRPLLDGRRGSVAAGLGRCRGDGKGPPVDRPGPERRFPALHNIGIPVCAENFLMNSHNGVAVWELLKARFGLSMLPEVLCDAQ